MTTKAADEYAEINRKLKEIEAEKAKARAELPKEEDKKETPATGWPYINSHDDYTG